MKKAKSNPFNQKEYFSLWLAEFVIGSELKQASWRIFRKDVAYENGRFNPVDLYRRTEVDRIPLAAHMKSFKYL